MNSDETKRPLKSKSRRSDDANAFLPDPAGGRVAVKDDLAESLAEGFVNSVTSAEDGEDEVQEPLEEEIGPFIVSPAGAEFAEGTDESNPPGTEPAPLPTV